MVFFICSVQVGDYFSSNIYNYISMYLETGYSEIFMIGSGMWELFSNAKLGGKYT